MPTRSELRRQAHEIPNPFEDEIPRIKEYTAKEIAILQSRLDKQLGPEYISTRKGPGGQNVHYLGAEKIINLANEVFGFNGWSTSIRDTTIDYVDIEKDGRVSMGLSVIIRVTLRDGTYHEDVGYGTIANCSGKGAAFEKTKKEATTDAMKRALRNFGNVLGNCLYDKEYLKKVVKIKPPPTKWNVEDLHRHPDVVPPKATSVDLSTEKSTSLPPTRTMSGVSRASAVTTDYDDEFGGNAFDDVDFTRSDEFSVHDTMLLEDEAVEAQQSPVKQESMHAKQPLQRIHSVAQSRPQPQSNTGQRPTIHPPPARPPIHQRPGVPVAMPNGHGPSPQAGRMAPPQQQSNDQPSMQGQQGPSIQQRATSAAPEQLQQRPPSQVTNVSLPSGPQAPEATVGFVRGRVAEMVQSTNGQLPANAAFNPHAESPSIRKTNGVNHRTSAPVRREDIGTSLPPTPVVQIPAQNNAHVNANSNMNGASPPSAATNHLPPLPRPNFVNPLQDPHRRIGAPLQTGMQSPGPRPGGYRPPGPAGVKRGPPDVISRPPLNDVSNVNKLPPGDAGVDGKRLKVQGQDGNQGHVAAT